MTRDSLTINARKLIYFSLIYPHLIYCNTVWGAVNKTTIKPIVTAQKRVIRTIVGYKKYDHTNEAFIRLRLLKLNDVNIYFSALLVHNSINVYDNNWFSYRQNQRYPLRNSNLLKLPFITSHQSKSCILYHGVSVWNSLPSHLMDAPSLYSFKRLLKEFLISQY